MSSVQYSNPSLNLPCPHARESRRSPDPGTAFKLGMVQIVVSLVIFLIPARLCAQSPDAGNLAPSEELRAAMAPYEEARAQPNDLTQADLMALGVSINRADRACHKLETSVQHMDPASAETLSYARLCIFGLQHQQALDAIGRYLQQPDASDRELALLLRTKALLGMNALSEAASQVFAIRKEYGYNSSVNSLTSQLILLGTLGSDELNGAALALCREQLNNTLPLVETGKGLPGKEVGFAPGILFSDAVRCFEIERALHDASADATLARLQTIVQLPAWQDKAELPIMKAALARARMAGADTPLRKIAGKLIDHSDALSSYFFDASRGNILLVPFTLWAPGEVSTIRDLHATFPQQPIYLLTSWAANTGGADTPNNEILGALREMAKTAPPHVQVMVVPDTVLEQFHVDIFPLAITIRDGIIKANIPLIGNAGKRLTVLALGTENPEQRAQR